MFKQFHEEALESISLSCRQKLSTAREVAYAKRMAPSRTKLVMQLLTTASHSGQAENVRMVVCSANDPRDEFPDELRKMLPPFLRLSRVLLHLELT